jgi:6-phosphogluconolactonase
MARAVVDVSAIEAESIPALIARMAADLQKKITAALAGQNRFTLVLSGGSTPRQLYETLAKPPYLAAIPWQRLWIFWGDERPVPPTDPESNFHTAQDALLRHVPILAEHIFRMKGELPPAEAAADYQRQLQAVFGAESSVPVFDLILLGLGPDGHTASLFPGTPALDIRDCWVTENRVSALNTTRLTLTLPVLNSAREIWFLAAGKEKAAAYARVRAAPDVKYPASLVSPRQGNVRWYLDNAILHSDLTARKPD